MTDLSREGFTLGDPAIEAFKVTNVDGTTRMVHCQQVYLTTGFVLFFRVNDTWTSQACILGIATEAVYSVTPVYRTGTGLAALAQASDPEDVKGASR